MRRGSLWDAARIFVIWTVITYCSYILLIAALTWFLKQNFQYGLLFSRKAQAILLIPAALPPALATLILWLLPIRHAWLGIVTGILLTLGGIVLSTWITIVYFGNSDNSPGIFLEGFIMVGPSCLVGAYAGLARSKIGTVQPYGGTPGCPQ
jgi:ABC-type sugar transport system permease subunit